MTSHYDINYDITLHNDLLKSPKYLYHYQMKSPEDLHGWYMQMDTSMHMHHFK